MQIIRLLDYKITRLFIFFIFIILFSSPVLAIEATNSAVSEDEVKEKIKERLEETVREGLEKIKGVITQEKENQLYAWVGTITIVNKDKLQIQTKTDLCETQVASNAAIYFLPTAKGKQTIKAGDIKKGQFVIAMGPKIEDKLILGKRILTMDEAPENGAARDLKTGKVNEIDEKTVTIKKNGDSFKISLDDDVNIQVNGIKKPTVEDIQIDDQLTALVVLDKEGNIESVKSVLVVPGKTNPQAVENDATQEDIKESSPAADN